MKRFYFGDDEERENEDMDDMEDMGGDLGGMYPDPSEFITMTQFSNPNEYLLGCAIRICEKSFFWKFRKETKKIEIIERIFKALKKMTEGQQDAQI